MYSDPEGRPHPQGEPRQNADSAESTQPDAAYLPQARSRRMPEFLRQIVVTLFFGALFAVLLQVTVQNYVVEGTSMLPNVQSGDRVLVDRLAYKVGSPKRGDIVVFKFPYSDTNLIKRVIGLPGDTVMISPARLRSTAR